MGIEAVGDRALLGFDQPHALVSVETVKQQVLAARDHRNQPGLAEAIHVEERQRVDDHVLEGEADPVGPLAHVADHHVGVQHTLGMPGGARGVADHHRLVGIDRIGAGGEHGIAHRLTAGEHRFPAHRARHLALADWRTV